MGDSTRPRRRPRQHRWSARLPMEDCAPSQLGVADQQVRWPRPLTRIVQVGLHPARSILNVKGKVKAKPPEHLSNLKTGILSEGPTRRTLHCVSPTGITFLNKTASGLGWNFKFGPLRPDLAVIPILMTRPGTAHQWLLHAPHSGGRLPWKADLPVHDAKDHQSLARLQQ